MLLHSYGPWVPLLPVTQVRDCNGLQQHQGVRHLDADPGPEDSLLGTVFLHVFLDRATLRSERGHRPLTLTLLLLALNMPHSLSRSGSVEACGLEDRH